MTRITLVLLALGLVGCTSAGPNAWLLYSKSAYLYGRIEAKAETHCAKPIPPDRVDVCTEAAAVKEQVHTLAPIIQGELSKDKPDWAVILKYVDLVFSLAAKAL